MKTHLDSNLKNLLDLIKPANTEIAKIAKEKLDNLTKPKGSLGVLEDCAVKYLSARGNIEAKINNPVILTFAGDHGVAKEGVSAFPQEVTVQMLANFANGGAAINVLARHAGAKLKVIDIGAAADCKDPKIIKLKAGYGSANFAKSEAMTIEQCEQAIIYGAKIAAESIEEGADLICTGDMGIANTCSSSAIYSLLLDLPAEDTVGRGTGIDDMRLQKKLNIVRDAVKRFSHLKDEPFSVLASVGGFEIAGICGAIIQAAAKKIPVIVDGFISGAAAITAIKAKKEIMDYCFFSHLSAEAGHAKVLNAMGVRPLLNLDLRLGEGTGAALAINIVTASIKIINEMASFKSAKVSNKE